HPADREPTRQAIEHAIATHATYDVEYRTQGPDGHLRWVRAIGHAQYEDDVPVRFDGITIDITELVRLRTEAEAASRAKDEFLAMLGHELRNPLAPIRTALELLKMRGIAAIEHERAVIERQVANLVRLVDDLLDVARIARGRIALTRRPVHLAEIIARAVETVSPLLEKQRHLLDVFVAPDLVLDADEARLTQVVANLLSNAAKYTPPGGRVSVSAFADQGAVHISIADNGVGIDEALQATVFDTFVQGERQLARSEGGLGLGLAIVRNLVELHEGVVTVHSAGPGHGSTFTIRLPQGDRRAADLEAARGTANGPAAGDAARVLIVDDNEDAAQMLAAILESEGYATATAADGPSALAAARLSVPAIALVDIGLPLMDGYQLARHFKEDAELMKVPLVALTGYGQDQDRQQSAAAGFAAHLVKPVDLDRLRAVVEAFLTGTGTT
ncbi:MAG TPA: ATP-binding protein, partial [Luteitalea sp.]|nr:ATP-binding protein [Luteitalea sp.]